MMKIFQTITVVACMLNQAFGSALTHSLSPLEIAVSDFKNVHKYYQNNPQLTVDTYYMAFDNHQSGNFREGKSGAYVKNATSYYTKILNLETLCIPEMVINVDHSERMIVIGDNDASPVGPFALNLDSLFYLCSSIECKNLNANERKYSLDLSDNEFSEYDKIEITLDIKNFRFTTLAFYYRAEMNLTNDYQGQEQQPRMEIAYKNYRTTVSNKLLLDKNAYILEAGGQVLSVGKYKSYKVLDQRKKNRIKGYKK
jgi:hypothetical protein